MPLPTLCLTLTTVLPGRNTVFPVVTLVGTPLTVTSTRAPGKTLANETTPRSSRVTVGGSRTGRDYRAATPRCMFASTRGLKENTMVALVGRQTYLPSGPGPQDAPPSPI